MMNKKNNKVGEVFTNIMSPNNNDVLNRSQQVKKLSDYALDKNSPLTQKIQRTRSGNVNDTYTRSTYLIRNDLKEQLDTYAQNPNAPRGFKTTLINEALYHLFNDKEYFDAIMNKLMSDD